MEGSKAKSYRSAIFLWILACARRGRERLSDRLMAAWPHNAAVPPAPRSPRATTYRLTLEYEGTRYHGWQEQQNARSVAGELRRALEGVVGKEGESGGSGGAGAG